jgi:hypothetical protein
VESIWKVKGTERRSRKKKVVQVIHCMVLGSIQHVSVQYVCTTLLSDPTFLNRFFSELYFVSFLPLLDYIMVVNQIKVLQQYLWQEGCLGLSEY